MAKWAPLTGEKKMNYYAQNQGDCDSCGIFIYKSFDGSPSLCMPPKRVLVCTGSVRRLKMGLNAATAAQLQVDEHYDRSEKNTSAT
ncbi:MAG: hypothetical protein KJ720_03785 [Proteobacteria bacterium]|nr:hypothetical protein [Pseudomonadota bacterium]MBU1452963.1 hypothetical protein [Pseudomonadota bacterium]MBU2467925.1 hypothetical protein [Pseudomonadota bacterium]MBU2517403.1 hypothetical protein [Pseudomonadota bacterium]